MGSEPYDVLVIGAGSAGLTAAGGCAMFGLKVALIEPGKMGGECLNTGCVPSKALLAAAAKASEVRNGARFGVEASPSVHWPGVRAHIDGAIATIAPHDSQLRFEGLGVEVIRTRARFLDGKTLLVGNRRLSAPRIVIATGSIPLVPKIDGLAEVPFLTNENLFALDGLPERLVVLGAGAVGTEMAQAFRRLGSEVTVISRGRPLEREDPEAAELVIAQLRQEGVKFAMGQAARRVTDHASGVAVELSDGTIVEGSDLLVATGRKPNLNGLALDLAGVEAQEDGVVVDARRRTTNRRIYAIGDCRAGPRFTHVAGYEGSLVALEIALAKPSRVDWRALPRVLYTSPELAQIGQTEDEARKEYGAIEVIREKFATNDRAVTDGNALGFMKVIRHRNKVVGVTIVGTHAGELLLPWTQIITGKSTLFALGSAIVPYPTRSESSKAAAFTAYSSLVFGRWPKRWATIVARTRRLLA